MIGIGWVLGNWWVECLGEGGLIRPACGQPLASKCRFEPTGFCWGENNSRFTSSCNGTVKIRSRGMVVSVVRGDVEESCKTTLQQQAVFSLFFQRTLLERPATGRSNFRRRLICKRKLIRLYSC